MIIDVTINAHTQGILDVITNRINSPSRSDTIRRAVELMYSLVGYTKEGDDIYIVNSNGDRKRVIIKR